jgi:hypothetical protein
VPCVRTRPEIASSSSSSRGGGGLRAAGCLACVFVAHGVKGVLVFVQKAQRRVCRSNSHWCVVPAARPTVQQAHKSSV